MPVTIKSRIGIDNFDSYQFLLDFIGPIADRGCETFIIHARKALLDGLSPAENRTVPPLKWDVAYQLKKDFPKLNIILNGGIKTLEHVREGMTHTDGVMIGREAYGNPYFLSEIEGRIFGTAHLLSREEVVERMIPYIDAMAKQGEPLKDITRHMLGLFQGMPGARRWRQVLSQEAYKPNADSRVVRHALAEMAASAARREAA